MRRRIFLTIIGGAAMVWSLPVRSQERIRRISALLPATAGDLEFQSRMAAFQQELVLLGWTVGKNLRIDVHWATPDPSDVHKYAVELLALSPDVILAFSNTT